MLWARMGPEVRSFLEQNRPGARALAERHEPARRALLPAWHGGIQRPPGGPSGTSGLCARWRFWKATASKRPANPPKHGPGTSASYDAAATCGQHGWIMERSLGARSARGGVSPDREMGRRPATRCPPAPPGLRQTMAADALTEPLSEMLRYSYLLYRRDLRGEPGSDRQLRRTLAAAGRSELARPPESCHQSLALSPIPGVPRSRRATTSSGAGACFSFSSPTGCPRPIDLLPSAHPWQSKPRRSSTRPTRRLPRRPAPYLQTRSPAALDHTILARYAVRGSTPDQEGKSFLHSKHALGRRRRSRARKSPPRGPDRSPGRRTLPPRTRS